MGTTVVKNGAAEVFAIRNFYSAQDQHYSIAQPLFAAGATESTLPGITNTYKTSWWSARVRNSNPGISDVFL